MVADVRKSPWGLIVILFFVHEAPEIALTGLIPIAIMTTFKIWVCIMLVRHVLPPLANLLTGPGKRQISRIRAARPIPGRA